MTDKQQKWFNTALWPQACRAQGWAASDQPHKLRVISQIIGREILSTKDVEWGKEFDLVKRELVLLANPNSFTAALATVTGGREDQRKRWLKKLESFQPSYVAALVSSFSHRATENPSDLDDTKLKAVVVTCEERARVKPELRGGAAVSPASGAGAATDDVPFTDQF